EPSASATPLTIHVHPNPQATRAAASLTAGSRQPSVVAPGTTRAPLASLEGIFDTGATPPDTNGAVSSQYVVSTVNNAIDVKTRSGTSLMTKDLGAFWNVAGQTNSFDTRVRFDPYGQRFIVISAARFPDLSASGFAIAVSQTSDPTGGWWAWRITIETTNWLDYPTVGFNHNWIVVSANLPGNDNNPSFTRIWAFTKSALYADNLSYRTLPGVGWTVQPAETYDDTVSDEYMMRLDLDTGVSLYKVTGAIGSEQVVLVNAVSSPQSWSGPPAAPQTGSSATLPTAEDWLLDAVYRNGSVWGTNVVQPSSGPPRSAVQWWKVSSSGALQDFGRIDDPTGVAYYGMSSVAVNKNGDALIGFTRFSADTHPSAAYAYRLSTDPAGTFRAPVVYKAGVGIYEGGRWGDYSHTQVDPVNDIDMWTVQEYTGAPAKWDTWWADVSPTSTACSTNADCDDGVFCNGAETCASGSCQAGTSWGQACYDATPLSRYQNSGPIGTAEKWFVVTDNPINGWNASSVGSRQIRVNGVLVSPGQMPLPAPYNGKRYFQFTAGTPAYTSVNFW
ncbi:MAG: hypothetical protein ACJ8F1_20570, partial [Polyangia bacterium]